MNTMIEMTALMLHRPAADASAERVRYRAKAALHERLAAQGGSDSRQHSALAASALEKSLQLLRGH